ncbi:hypothetical protein BVRB_014400 isoform A [Beta vulgaris subsp. vulgaris]|uniref:FAD-binding PCMH-type domain-containing protein n=1 Tax=Beta vulgaris subsp. vulgaris TaxID=3555 RepID=A0A0J8B4W0_BETVV|nr:hypothetical protein BVRB_014400 isoform A [Beta vulgaris subsp. vulgaris]
MLQDHFQLLGLGDIVIPGIFVALALRFDVSRGKESQYFKIPCDLNSTSAARVLLSSQTPPTEQQIEESLAGNLCRCTGYRPIIDAFRVFAETDDMIYTFGNSASQQGNEFICPSTGKPCSCGQKSDGNTGDMKESGACSERYKHLSYSDVDGSKYNDRELIFPPELLLRRSFLSLSGFNGLKWYRPLSLQLVLELKSKYPDARLVIGNTEVGIEMRLKRMQYKALVSVAQIRNVASVGGNICTASPISDLNPLWMAAGAKFQIIDSKGNIRPVLAEDFFLGYRKVDLSSDEILLSIHLPWTRPFEFVKEFKQAHRRDDDIALVNAGMRVHLEKKDEEWLVSDASIVYGAVAAVSFLASKTKEFLIGKSWNKDLLGEALKVLEEDIFLREDAPGGMSWQYSHPIGDVMGSQDYDTVKHGAAVGSPEVQLCATLQVTGEAEYVDDMGMPPNGLHAALILSKKPHARIVSIDDSGAKTLPGFAGIFFAKDVPGDNHIGPVVADEELFASELVTCVGQVIGIVVADTHENAKLAAGKVHVEYAELHPVLSIEDALKFKSFHPGSEKQFLKGDVDLCFQLGACDRIIEGEVQVGGQEHFYLETQSSLVWTMDGGNEVHMISSTQAPQKHQKYVSHVLGLPMSKVICKTKRIGGGFGGKETRSAFIAAAASVPSYLLNRHVKLTLDRDVDMMITGQRHSFLGKYKVGFTNEGKVLALDLEIYNNAGNSLDLSLAILERAMFHSDNVYEIPNGRINGKVCFTNLPSNTAFRGFGGPQGMLIAENWIQRIAMELEKNPEEIREINFQSEGSILHYGQILEHCTLPELWNQLKLSCDFHRARAEVDDFNVHNPYLLKSGEFGYCSLVTVY